MVWCDRPDAVENIDEDEEESDQHGHPARHHLGLDQEADPADDHKHGAGEVDLHTVMIDTFPRRATFLIFQS